MSLAIYFIIFLFLSFITLISISQEGRKYELILLIAVSFLLICFAGLREGSPDQGSYSMFFHKVADLEGVLTGNNNYQKVYGEWGFLFSLSFVKYFTEDPMYFFLAIAFFSVGIVAYACRRVSPYPLFSILCYYSWFYYSNLGAIRHAVSSALVLLLITFVAQNRKSLSFPVYLSSVSYHSASISGALVWFTKLVNRRSALLFFLFVILGLSIFVDEIAKKLVQYMIPFLGDYFGGKLTFYLNSDLWNVEESIARGVVIKGAALVLVCFYFKDTLVKKFSAFPVVYGTYVFGIFTLLLFIDMKIISNRISNLLSIGEIVLIPMLFSLVPAREKTLVFLLVLSLLFFQFNMLVGHEYYPYRFLLTY